MVYEFTTWSAKGAAVPLQVSIEPGYKFQWIGRRDGHQIPQRLHAAFRPSGWKWPGKRITVLCPSESELHAGSDLALAVSVLLGSGQWRQGPQATWAFYGAVDLFGKVSAVPGDPIPEHLPPHCEGLVVPMDWKARWPENPAVIGVSTLQEVCDFLARGLRADSRISQRSTEATWPNLRLSKDLHWLFLVVAAGRHPTFLMGPPGTGKTQMARLWWKLLDGAAPKGAFMEPLPPRSSKVPAVSWLTNCQGGCLFLDEVGEWPLKALEALRKPLEEAQSSTFYVAASNPCPCGFHGHASRPCTCPPGRIQAYQRRFSGPFLDRFHLYAYVQSDPTDVPVEWSEFRHRLKHARKRQAERGLGSNGQLPAEALGAALQVQESAWSDLRVWQQRMGMGERSVQSVLRVARTVADLENSLWVQPRHIRQAAQWHWSNQGFISRSDPWGPERSWSTSKDLHSPPLQS